MSARRPTASRPPPRPKHSRSRDWKPAGEMSGAESTTRKYDLYSDRFRANTYATFAEMREHDPVFCQPGIDGQTPIWFVTRHDDVVAVLLDDERFVRDPLLALGEEE